MTAATRSAPTAAAVLKASLGAEGLRLFFPLSAVQAGLWPLLWIFVHGFDLPLARTTPPGLWHAHEMLFGAYGAALIGFLTTAIPEWTDTRRPQGRTLFLLAGLWLPGRLIGLIGSDVLVPLAGATDAAWLGWLALYVLRISWAKRTDRLLAFLFWIVLLFIAELACRWGFLSADPSLAQRALLIAGLAFLGLLGLALARVTPPITNQILDPTEATTPFRPHPGRMSLAPGLVALLVGGEAAGLSSTVTAYLAIAAGAAFLDRVAESFVGRESFRAEIAVLGASSALAGAGLLMIGASRLGAPLAETAGLHLSLMGGLGLGVMAVFGLAGLLHTGQPLRLDVPTRMALLLLILSVAVRVAPDLGVSVPGPAHGIASMLWALAFALWLRSYWPLFANPQTASGDYC